MLDILPAFLFLLGFLHNIIAFRKVRLRIYIRTLDKLVLGIISLIFLYISYSTRNDLISYFSSLSLTGFFISGICFKGLGDEDFFLTTNRGLIIRRVNFKDIENVSYRDKNNKDYFELKLVTKIGVAYEVFKNEDRDKLERALNFKRL